MSNHTTSIPFLLALALAATACGSDSKQLPAPWSELKLPEAKHAEILLTPNERTEDWLVEYKGFRSYYGLCKEYVEALAPLGFTVRKERVSPIGAVDFYLDKGDRIWDLSCQYFENNDHTGVHMKPLTEEGTAALLAEADDDAP